MSKGRRDEAREYLERKSADLAEQAARGESIPADLVDALNRLARLIEIRDAAAPRRRAWWAAGTFSGALIIVSVLLFARVAETDIEVDLLVSGLRFATASDQLVAGALRVSSLGASRLREIRVPSPTGPDEDTVQSDAGDQAAVRISPDAGAKPPGTVAFAPLVLPAGASVALRTAESPREFVLSFQASGQELRADVEGAVSVGVAGSPPKVIKFTSPKPIMLRTGSADVDLALTFPSVPQTPLAPQLSVSGLSFSRVDQFLDGGRSLVRRVSTVLSGTLFLESLDGEKFPLRPAEELQFAESSGEIRELRLEDNQIAVRYHGRVRGMTTGSGEGHRSLMPTYLEWMRARHGLSLFWGATLYLTGLIAGALRWWGVGV
jgi:hypothetical protein